MKKNGVGLRAVMGRELTELTLGIYGGMSLTMVAPEPP